MAGEDAKLARDEVQSAVGDMCEAEIDYNVMGTFPASDPPSWTLGISPRKKARSKFEEKKLTANDPSHQNEVV
jgi:hypothetical protein